MGLWFTKSSSIQWVRLMFGSLNRAEVHVQRSLTAASLCIVIARVPGTPAMDVEDIERLSAAAVWDGLEHALLKTSENDAAWLTRQVTQLEHALLVLLLDATGDAGPDYRLTIVASALRQVIDACRERLVALAETSAALQAATNPLVNLKDAQASQRSSQA